MPWLMFALSLLSLLLLFSTHSMAFAFLCVLGVLGFLGAGIIQLADSRIGGGSRDSGHILTPEEIRMYREQAQARKEAAASGTAPKVAAPSDPRGDIIDGEFQEVGKAPMIPGPTDSSNSAPSNLTPPTAG